MKIGIDISQIAYPGFGVATYTQKLVEALLKIDKENEYTLFFSSMRRSLKTDFKGAVLKKYRFPPTLLDFLWNKLHALSIETLIGEIDIFHSSNWTQPPSKAKKVTTIHDMLIYKYPETVHPKIIATQKRQLSWVKKECDRIITDSYATKKDVIEILNIPEEKIKVVHLAPGKEFNQTHSKEDILSVRNKYGIKDNYILTVGSQEPRKNLPRIIEAFKELKPDFNMQLIIAGSFRWGDKHMESPNIKDIGFVNKTDLPALYAGANLFVYPSLYEGFGLPVLEAQSCGCPVATSNKGSLKEIVGDSAIIVDPQNTESIKQGIVNILLLDQNSLNNLKIKGRINAQSFTWEKTAKETLKVYEELR